MTRHYLFFIAINFAGLLLVSCATINEQVPEKEQSIEKQQVISEPAGWPAEQHKRQQIIIWEIRGRLGVQAKTNGGSMDIIWKQSDDDFSIRLIAPLGAGTHLIQGDAHFVEIRYSDGHKQIVNNVDDIFSSVLEIELPVDAVRDWIRGLPARAMPVESMRWNDQGLLERIKQSGWNVEMKNYLGSKTLLPHSIYLSRDNNSELDVRLVLRQWLVDN